MEQEIKKIFGTDGVRGRANYFPMTVEIALCLGRALGETIRRHKGHGKVVIGKDTRLSCYMYENALISGLCSMGVNTLMLGPFPTPGVAFITRAYRADAGIVISASHNPFNDNGIKFFSSEGYKLPDSWEKEIEEMVDKNDFSHSIPMDHDLGRNAKVDDANGRYIEFVKGTFPKKLTLDGMKVAVDCANGAGYRVAPCIFGELGAKMYLFGHQPNGLNINLNCGSLHLEQIRQGVLNNRADVGIALDGDADRVILIDEKGKTVNGDKILAICALDLKERGLLTNDTVVSTVMCNYGVVKFLEARGVRVIQAQVGDRYVIQEMLQSGAEIGGEQSGHLIFHEHSTTGDALIAALQVLKIMREKGVSLSSLADPIQEFSQVLLNVKVDKKVPVDEMPEVKKAIEESKERLRNSGRLLVRYSGTENICRIMVEGENPEMNQKIAKEIENALKRSMAQMQAVK
jgi:phosphoglucosamine mutase